MICKNGDFAVYDTIERCILNNDNNETARNGEFYYYFFFLFLPISALWAARFQLSSQIGYEFVSKPQYVVTNWTWYVSSVHIFIPNCHNELCIHCLYILLLLLAGVDYLCQSTFLYFFMYSSGRVCKSDKTKLLFSYIFGIILRIKFTPIGTNCNRLFQAFSTAVWIEETKRIRLSPQCYTFSLGLHMQFLEIQRIVEILL